MPIAKFQLPDGRVGRFEVPEGTSPEQAMELISANLSSLLPKPQERPPLEGVSETPLAAPNVMTAKQYQNDVEKRAQEPSSRSASDYVKDAGITFLKGAIGLPESFVGLADIPTRGEAGKMLAQAGYKPAEAKSILDTYLSEAQQAANRKVSEAKGFFPTIGASLQNPSTIATSVGESLPQMIGGAGIARGAIKAVPAMAPYFAGALGEGVLGAGSAAEQMRQESDTGLLTGKQSAAAIGSGIGTGIFGLVAGKLADKLGLDNVNTMLAGRAAKGEIGSVKDFVKQAAASGVTEGLFEELPQSAQEQMWMNYAQDKPLLDGVAEAAASGLVAGVAMGTAGTAIGRKAYTPQENAVSATPPQVEPQFEVAPTKSKPPIDETAPQVAPKAEEPIDENAPSQDQEEMMQELGLAPKKEQVPIVSPELGGGASHVLPPKVEVTHAYPMGENTEYQVLRTPTGYVANLFDKDAGKYVLGSARAYPIQTFGADAEIKANEFAQEQMHKAAKFNPITPTVAPETTKETPLLEAPKSASPVQGQSLYDRIGNPMGPAQENAKNEILPIDEAVLLKKVIVKTVDDGLARGKTRQQIVDQLAALTKGGIKPSDFQRINDYMTERGVQEEPKPAPLLPKVEEPKKTFASNLSPEFQEAYEHHLKSAEAANKVKSMVRVGTATQAQAQPFIEKSDKARANMYDVLFKEKDNLSDSHKEIVGLAERAIKANQRGFAEGMLNNVIKDVKITPENLDFYNTRVEELEAQAKPKESKPIKETHNLETLLKDHPLDQKRLEKFGNFDEKTKESIAKTNEYLQKLTAAINAKGFNVFEQNKASIPKDVQDLSSAFTSLYAGATRILLNTQHVAGKQARKSKKSYGTQSQEIQEAQKKLHKSHIDQNKDFEKARDLLGEVKRKEPKAPVVRPELTKPPEPEEIVRANEDIEYAEKEARRTKELSRSLWTALRSKLTSSNVSNLGKGYELLKAGKGKPSTDISTLVANGALDDFLPYHMRHDSDMFEEQDSVEYIYQKLRAKNYITFAADVEIQQLMGSVEEAEALIHEYFKLKEINALIDQAADEQREAEINARVLEPEGETRAAPTGAPELTLQGETPEEVRAKEKEKEDRAKAEKEAEAKAKADEGVAEFTLTGSNRPADLAAAKGQESLFGEPIKKEEEPKNEIAKTSKAYDVALEESRQASRDFTKYQLAYRAMEIGDEEFLNARKEYDAAMTKFDKALAAESKGIPMNDPNIIDGANLVREIGKEKQFLLIAEESKSLTDKETAALEEEYGAKSGTDEFLQRLHDDVSNFITKGANSVKNKIRGIINKIANSLLSVAVAFNMNYVSAPVNVVVPAYTTTVQEVIQEAPEEAAKDMSPQARRAYEVLYPSLKDELIKENKLFLVTDKPTAMQFIFNPDGTLLMKSKVLLAKGIGDFEKGNNNIDANKITPAGVRTLVKRFHTTSTEGYDFDTVFGTMGTDEKTGGKYFSTVYHSVYTHLPDAQKRLQALQEPGAANSRYSFGCINVDKSTFGKLVKEHGDQMDGATLFVVPDNDQNVMEFINGKATSATDITRRKVEPTTKEIKTPIKEAKATEGEKLPAREEKFFNIFKFEPEFEEEKKRNPSFKRAVSGLNNYRNKGMLTDEEFALRVAEELEADNDRKSNVITPARKRGILHIKARMNAEANRGAISKEAVDLAEWFMNQNPALVDDLGISIKAKELGTGGFYANLSRVMTLMKDAGNEETPVHEILHHTERMMPTKVKDSIRKEWVKQLFKAQKNAKTQEEKVFFAAVINSHFGDNQSLRIEVKDKNGNEDKSVNKFLYDTIMKATQQGQRPSSAELAKFLLQHSDLPIENYRFVNPSEFWAVNGSRIVAGDYASVQGSTLAKLKNWLGKLAEKIKSLFGFRSDAPIIRALESLSKSDGAFQTKDMLGAGNYENIKKNYQGGPAPAASFDSPTDTKMDDILRHIQDKHIDTKRLVQELEKDGKKIGEEWNPYVKEELYHGRTASKIKTFLDDELVPLVKEMGEHKVTLADFDEYLYMRHAEERNEQIASINPTYSDVDLTPGSGKSTSEAKKYLNNLPADKRKVFESLAAKVDAIIKGTQDALIDGGLETKETINDWNKTYKHYVPLQRNEEELDFVHHGSGLGQGMSTKGGTSRRAFGSLKSVVDVFSNIALQRERAIIRSEKAVVGKALYGLALQNPNPDFWLAVNPDAIKNKKKLYEELTALGLTPAVASNIIQEPKVATIDPLTGLVRYEVNPVLRSSDNVFPVRINGKDRYVFFNNKDERAKNIVKAMKNLDSEQLGYVFGMAGDMTRWIAAVNTQYNPVFGAWNFLRDVGGATFNLSTTPIADKKWQVNKNVFPAMFAIYGDLRGNRKGIKGNEEMQKWHQSFLGAGGATGYSEQFSRGRSKINGEKLETIVEKELGKLNRGNVSKAAHVVFDWLSDYNDAMENAVRLSAFKVYLENNMSKAEINALLNGGNITLDMQRHIDKAASIAKNLTVNFNRKGSASQLYQSLFAFFNASVQGTARLAETLKGPAGRKIMAGGFALGAIQAIALAMAGYDDDEPPEYLKNKNLIIPLGDTYLIAPLPLGLNIFPGIGRIATEYVLGKMGFITGAKGGASKVGDVLALALDTFNPLGGGSLAQMMTPTIADPIIALRTNKDAFGRPISKEDISSHPTPGYLRSRENANVIAQGISEFLNYASGGNEDVKGGFSPTADQISYFAGQYTGGVGRELMKGVDFGSSLFTGEPLPSYRVPIVGKMYGETNSPAAIQDKFYKNVVIMSEHEDSLKGRLKRHEDRQEYMQEHPEARLWKMANSIENQISALNKQRKQLIESGAPDSKIENNRERKTHLMEKFNDKVKELQSD